MTSWIGRGLGDLPVYAHTYRLISLGMVPYRDFRLEYPPLSAGLFWLAGVIPGPYDLVFSLLMLAFLIATILGTWFTARALPAPLRVSATAVGMVAIGPALMGSLTQTRYDIVVAAIVVWMVYFAITERWKWVWILMGIAALAKLVPLVVAPALVLFQLRRFPWRQVIRSIVPGAVIVLGGLLPFVLIAPGGLWQVAAYHLERPLQIESLGATILLAIYRGIDLPIYHVNSYGSDNLAGPIADLTVAVSGVFSILVVAAVLVSVARLPKAAARERRYLLIAAVAATLAGTTATGKVLSPQYLLWLMPLVVLAAGRRWAWAAAVLAVAMALSQVIFPNLYRLLIEEYAGWAVLSLIARNACLLALTWLVWPRSDRMEDRPFQPPWRMWRYIKGGSGP